MLASQSFLKHQQREVDMISDSFAAAHRVQKKSKETDHQSLVNFTLVLGKSII